MPIVSLTQDKEFYDECKQLGDPIRRLGWMGICAFDVLTKARLAIRPTRLRPGGPTRSTRSGCRQICELIETRPALTQVLAQMRRAAAEFAAVPVDRSRPRPRIGMVGEIYVRHHDFANNDLMRQLERLGAETSLAGFPRVDLLHQLDPQGRGPARRSSGQWLTNVFQDRVQRKIHRQFNATMAPLLEPLIGPLGRAADRRTAGLGRAVYRSVVRGRSGPLRRQDDRVAPPRLPRRDQRDALRLHALDVVGGVMKKLTAALGQMPALSISYDGQQDPMLQTRLEAFVYQARAYQAKNDHPHHAPHRRAARQTV